MDWRNNEERDLNYVAEKKPHNIEQSSSDQFRSESEKSKLGRTLKNFDETKNKLINANFSNEKNNKTLNKKKENKFSNKNSLAKETISNTLNNNYSNEDYKKDNLASESNANNHQSNLFQLTEEIKFEKNSTNYSKDADKLNYLKNQTYNNSNPIDVINANKNTSNDSGLLTQKKEFEKKLFSFLQGKEIFELMYSQKWEDRKQGFIKLNEIINTYNDDKNLYSLKENFEDLLAFMKFILKDFKENNFNILREAFSCYAELTKILSPEKVFDKKICLNFLKDLHEKLSEAKINDSLANLFFIFMEYLTPIFVVSNLIKFLEKSKSNSLLKEYSIFFEKCIEEFGIINIPAKEIVIFCKFLANNSNQQVRNASKSLLCVLYKFVGNDLKILLKDIKESTLKVFEMEFEKISICTPEELEINIRGKRTIKDPEMIEQQRVMNNPLNPKNNKNQNINNNNNNFINLMNVDISKKITTKITKDILEGKWSEKKEAFEAIDKILSDANYKILPNGLTEFILAVLKPKFMDSNKQLVRLSIQCFSKFIDALGQTHFKSLPSNLFKNIASPLLSNLSDKMQLVREDVLTCMDKWVASGGIDLIVSFIQEQLNKLDNFELRNDLLRFLLKNKELLGESPSISLYLKEFVNPMVKCLMDKVNIIRSMSEEFVEYSLNFIPISLYYDNIKDFKPAIKNSLKQVLEKYNNNNNNFNNPLSNNNSQISTKNNNKKNSANSYFDLSDNEISQGNFNSVSNNIYQNNLNNFSSNAELTSNLESSKILGSNNALNSTNISTCYNNNMISKSNLNGNCNFINSNNSAGSSNQVTQNSLIGNNQVNNNSTFIYHENASEFGNFNGNNQAMNTINNNNSNFINLNSRNDGEKLTHIFSHQNLNLNVNSLENMLGRQDISENKNYLNSINENNLEAIKDPLLNKNEKLNEKLKYEPPGMDIHASNDKLEQNRWISQLRSQSKTSALNTISKSKIKKLNTTSSINNIKVININKNNSKNKTMNNSLNFNNSRCETDNSVSPLHRQGKFGLNKKEKFLNFRQNKNFLDNSDVIYNQNVNNQTDISSDSIYHARNTSKNNLMLRNYVNSKNHNMSLHSNNSTSVNKNKVNHQTIDTSSNYQNNNKNIFQGNNINKNKLLLSSEKSKNKFYSKINNQLKNDRNTIGNSNFNRESSVKRLSGNSSSKNLVNITNKINNINKGIKFSNANNQNSLGVNHNTINHENSSFNMTKKLTKNFVSDSNLRSSMTFYHNNKKNRKENQHNTNAITSEVEPAKNRNSIKSNLISNNNNLNQHRTISINYNCYDINNSNNNSEIFNTCINIKNSKEKRNEIDKRDKINLDSAPTEDYVTKLKDSLRAIFKEEIYDDLVCEDQNVNINVLGYIIKKISANIKIQEDEYNNSNNQNYLNRNKEVIMLFEYLDIFLKWIYLKFSNTQNPVVLKGVLEFFVFLLENLKLFSTLENNQLELKDIEATILLYFLLNNQCVSNSKTKSLIKNLIFKLCGSSISLQKSYSILTNYITSPGKNQKLCCEAIHNLNKLSMEFGFDDFSSRDIKSLIKFSLLPNLDNILKTKTNNFLTSICMESPDNFMAVIYEFDINTKKILLEKFRLDKKPKRVASNNNFNNGRRERNNTYTSASDNENDLKTRGISKNNKHNIQSNKDQVNLNNINISNNENLNISLNINNESSFINNQNFNNLSHISNFNLKNGIPNNLGNSNIFENYSNVNLLNANINNNNFRGLENSTIFLNNPNIENNLNESKNQGNIVNFIHQNSNQYINNYNNDICTTNFEENKNVDLKELGSFTFKDSDAKYRNIEQTKIIHENNLLNMSNNTNNNKRFDSSNIINYKYTSINNLDFSPTFVSGSPADRNKIGNINYNHYNNSKLNVTNNKFNNISEFINSEIKNKPEQSRFCPDNTNIHNLASSNILNTFNENNQNINPHQLINNNSEIVDLTKNINNNNNNSNTLTEDSNILLIIDKIDVNYYNQTLESLVQLLDIIANKYSSWQLYLVSNVDNILSKFISLLREIFDEINLFSFDVLSNEKINITKYMLTTIYRIASKKELLNYSSFTHITSLFEILLQGLLFENNDKSPNHQQAIIVGYSINSIILKLLENFDYTKNFEILFDLILKYRKIESKAKIVSLAIKCLLKCIQILDKIINELKLDQILYKTHLIISQIDKEYPNLITDNKLDMIIIKFIKNIIFEFSKIKGDLILTEYIKFIEKIDVSDKYLKFWMKESMNAITGNMYLNNTNNRSSIKENYSNSVTGNFINNSLIHDSSKNYQINQNMTIERDSLIHNPNSKLKNQNFDFNDMSNQYNQNLLFSSDMFNNNANAYVNSNKSNFLSSSMVNSNVVITNNPVNHCSDSNIIINQMNNLEFNANKNNKIPAMEKVEENRGNDKYHHVIYF